MLLTAIGIFSLATILGMILISYVLTNKNIPKGIVITHGFFATIGIILLIIYAFFHHPSPLISIILFILATFDGFLLIYKDLTGQTVPKW
jgi:hypothetical protein